MTAGTMTGTQLLEALQSGNAPLRARLAAAKGVLPLPPEDLVDLQVLLLEDEDSQVREAAEASLATVEGDLVIRLADDPGTNAPVIDYLARNLQRWREAGPILARRMDTSGQARRTLATSNDPGILEALAGNSVALRADPDLAHLLLEQTALPRAIRNLLLDQIDELEKEVRAPRGDEEPPEEGRVPPEALPPARDPFLASLGVDAEVEALLPSLGLDVGQLVERSVLLGDPEEEDEDEGLIKRLSKMNVGQKLRVALFGSKEERTILVRDSNRIVAAAVVKNPKFTEQEADAVAKSRNVSNEVLRLVARSRDFSKNPAVQMSLITNPRTPVEISLHFIPQRNDRELKMLIKNRNVSDAVRRQAKKIYMAREARRRVRLRPGKH